jgi:NADH-ubiquinone oxidoreductase chain 2
MGFFAKQQVLYSSIHSGYYFLSFVAIIVSVISASYYLKLIKVMHFDLNSSQSINKQDGTNEEKDEANISNTINTSNSTEENILTNSHTFLISTFTLSILLFMLKPSILLNSTHLIALNIFIQ